MGDFDAFGDLLKDSAPAARAASGTVALPVPAPAPLPAPLPVAEPLPLPLPASPELTGLDLVEAEIDAVLTTIGAEREALTDSRFSVDGYVPTRSYGIGEEAVALGAAHERAHGIVVTTLTGLTTGLTTLQDVIADVRRLLIDVDRGAADELTSLLKKTEDIELGDRTPGDDDSERPGNGYGRGHDDAGEGGDEGAGDGADDGDAAGDRRDSAHARTVEV